MAKHRRTLVISAMKMTGWQMVEPNPPAFVRHIGQHVVCVARVYGGWTHRWQRGPAWTITESSPFGTLAMCLTDLWEHVVMHHDMADVIYAENLTSKTTRMTETQPEGADGDLL